MLVSNQGFVYEEFNNYVSSFEKLYLLKMVREEEGRTAIPLRCPQFLQIEVLHD
jgi:hypothetical protein